MTNQDELIDIANVDWNAFQIAKSGRAIKLLYKKEPVKFKTSLLYCPFGVKSVNKEWSNFTEYNVDCYMNQSSTENSQIFRKFLDDLDIKIQELIKSNGNIFDKGDVAYNNIMRENGNYPKLIKLQFPRDKNGNFKSVLFDESTNKHQITEDNIDELIAKGRLFKCVISCSKVWTYSGKAGTIWDIVQLKFFDKPQNADAQQTPENIYNTMMIED